MLPLCIYSWSLYLLCQLVETIRGSVETSAGLFGLRKCGTVDLRDWVGGVQWNKRTSDEAEQTLCKVLVTTFKNPVQKKKKKKKTNKNVDAALCFTQTFKESGRQCWCAFVSVGQCARKCIHLWTMLKLWNWASTLCKSDERAPKTGEMGESPGVTALCGLTYSSFRFVMEVNHQWLVIFISQNWACVRMQKSAVAPIPHPKRFLLLFYHDLDWLCGWRSGCKWTLTMWMLVLLNSFCCCWKEHLWRSHFELYDFFSVNGGWGVVMTETPNRLVQKHHKHDVCFRFGVFAWPSDVGIACRILPVFYV